MIYPSLFKIQQLNPAILSKPKQFIYLKLLNIKKMKNLKLPFIALLVAGLFTLVFLGCKKEASSPSVTSEAKAKTIVDKPILTCAANNTSTEWAIDLTICTTVGGTGAPAGFSVQWMSKEDLAANNGVWYASDDPRLCKASFSGNAKDSRYLLAAGQCVTVTIGDLLMDNGASLFNCADGLNCGSTYEFRVFAHANSTLTKSDFSYIECSTLPCDPNCSLHHFGWWKNNFASYPADVVSGGLYLGTVHYDATTLNLILHTPGSGDGLIILAHQLISAKLNGETSDPNSPNYNLNVANADAAIGGLVILTDHTVASWQKTLTGILNKYNNCQ